ncbi:uncharacterized protein [Henckelia pumila]|uniref:uncharacterized protein isoform X2 n=1 Tax=Henckelia pumila TaxID=405737 RepID=UPI003C6E43D6
MDSDEDFQSIPSEEEPSPQIQLQRLKRLKKANPKSPANSSLEPTGDPLLFSSVDFSKLEALENESGAFDSNDSNSADDLSLYQESVPQGNINDNEDTNKDNVDDGSNVGVKKKTKRALEFDTEHVGDVGGRSIDIELEKEQSAEEILPEEKGSKKKNKRGKIDDTEKSVNKRSEEKERKAHLKELHSETQRILRESSGTAFKQAPVTRKPISSILEKIRKRKLELSKKFSIRNDETCISEDNNSLREKLDYDVPHISEIITVEKDMVTSGVDVQRSLTPPKLDECDDVRPINHEDVNQELNEAEPMLPFRAPLQDTEDLFDDSQSNDNAVEPDSETQSGPLDNEFVPSVLDINLKFDSVPTDDSSDDEDNDKENVDPHHVIPGGSSSIGDYVKTFVDDEAEEEDDSDHDPDHLHENEEGEDVENYKDLEDMIATEYEERPIDKETRNALHQQWLEQQDATGTDNLLQRLKCGQGIRDTILPNKELESDEDDDEGFDDDGEAQEQMVPRNSARITKKKAKQIILQMFSDKEDVYLSDNDENVDWRIAKHRLIRNEEKGTLVSPVDDEDSHEVFSLIKKLDIATGNKKRPKPSSYFDTILKGGNSNSSSKDEYQTIQFHHPISKGLERFDLSYLVGMTAVAEVLSPCLKIPQIQFLERAIQPRVLLLNLAAHRPSLAVKT